jgi:PKD repeat protein
VAGGTGPYTYSWEFGDDSSRESNAQTVSHTFDQAGRYNVGLVVMDSRNQIASDSIAITVEEGESSTIEEEELNLDEADDNNSGLDAFFDLDDSLERFELQNNGITVGGTSAADDYDATADD